MVSLLPIVESIETRIVDVPTTRQHKLSNTSISHQSYTLVRIALSDGAIGYGEGATLGGPRWSEESAESISSVINTYLAPALVGQPGAAFEANALRMAATASRNFSAKAAVESALFDAVGHSLGLPAHQLLGGAVRREFEVIWAMASGDVEQEIEEARGKIAARLHRAFKIKIGFKSPEADLRRLTRLKEALPDIRLVVDVNQGWSEATACRFMPALEELGVDLVEQPLPAGQMEALARVTAASRVPVMIDEGAFTSAEVAQAGALHAADVLSLKLVKSGGLLNLKRIAGIASAHGMELYGGCLLESGIGAAAHLAVFATLPKLEWGTEHFGPQILMQDIVNRGPEFRDFAIHLPDGPGLGIEIDEDLIRDLSRGNWTSSA
jgi:muconate cycloisomerase